MNLIPNWLHRLASPPTFYTFAARTQPWLAGITLLLLGYGLVGGLALAPPDYQQGEGFRIIYVHVPAAWMSLFIYSVMAGAAAVALIWRIKLAECVLTSCAPIGASFTALALVSGMLWGKPMWGTYWTWDARLTSELILLFLYIGFIALHSAIEDTRRADRASAILCLVGAVNIPVIHYSVKWWNTLHQGASVSVSSGSSMSAIMLYTMLVMTLGFWAYAIAVALSRVRCIILERERESGWVKKLITENAQ
jgi:heme exporter protein C